MISANKVDKRSDYQLEDAFLSDKGRLIYSAPFRRMQQKAQVFSLESNSAVRSRLSHSLEVAHIGAYITHAITKKFKEDKKIDHNREFWITYEKAINTIVETTCLMHDIGNPPFGHFGESTISGWFKDEAKILNILKKAKIINQLNSIKLTPNIKTRLHLNDFILFDGNPQAIRIATKLQGEDGLTGFNFTFTQIAASLKYTSGEVGYIKVEGNHASSKLGFFSTEQKIIEKTWENLSIPTSGRHPLTFIMEAADDISYCTSDIDDGIEKGVIKEEELYKFILSEIKGLKFKISDKQVRELLNICKGIRKNLKISSFTEFKTTLSRMLVNKASTVFHKEFNDIVAFKKTTPLLIELEESKDIIQILCIIKKFTKKYIFTSHDVELTELSGHSIINGILNSYSPLLELEADAFLALTQNKKHKSLDKVTSRLYRTLPEKYLKSYINEVDMISGDIFLEWNLRAHLIVDFISGMTDQFALELYQSLTGIKVKS